MSKPLYQTIYEDLKHQIETGTVAINDTLPTEKNYQLPIVLVRSRSKSTGSVKEDGYIVRKPRKGSVVVTNKKADIVPNKLIFGLIITNFTDFLALKYCEQF